MDTVWLTLTVDCNNGNDQRTVQECFMFGPNGVVRFRFDEDSDRTMLMDISGLLLAAVIEDDAYIMKMLGIIRNTRSVVENINA